MQLLFFYMLILMSLEAVSADKYLLPIEIKSLSLRVVNNFNKLEKNMKNRYLNLLKKKILSEAETEELMAYEIIYYNAPHALLPIKTYPNNDKIYNFHLLE